LEELGSSLVTAADGRLIGLEDRRRDRLRLGRRLRACAQSAAARAARGALLNWACASPLAKAAALAAVAAAAAAAGAPAPLAVPRDLDPFASVHAAAAQLAAKLGRQRRGADGGLSIL